MTLQLSHDGLGQWIRTQDIDPMEWPETQALIKDGTLNAINCTLNFWNNSLFKNIDYYNHYLKQIFPDVYTGKASKEETYIFNCLYIKLNHIYNSTYDIKVKNSKGIYNGEHYDSLMNAPIGDLAFRNDTELANKYGISALAHNLEDYMHEFEHIAMLMMDPALNKSLDYKPFRSYINGQIDRYNKIADHDTITGACRAYQRYKYNVGDKKGQKPYTFVIDTLGNYSECNLIDSEHSVLNPGGEQASYCKGCKYEFQSECNTCGSMTFPDKCTYNYAWCQLLERLYWWRHYTKSIRRDEKNKLINNLISTNP
jgi:hypothetical protein